MTTETVMWVATAWLSLPGQEIESQLSLEATLLIMVLVVLCAAVPAAYKFLKDQKKLIADAEERSKAFEIAAEERAQARAEQLSLKAAQQLEDQLTAQLDRYHTRIMKLEAENAEKDKRLDEMQGDMMRMQEQGERLQGEMKVLKRRNIELVALVRRLLGQMDRHEIKPDVDQDLLNQLLA